LGFDPSWAKDPKIGQRMINARAKPFRKSLPFAVPFYPGDVLCWRMVSMNGRGKGRHNLIIFVLKTKTFWFAGLWEIWQTNPEGVSLQTCTIITCEANELVSKVHEECRLFCQERKNWGMAGRKQAGFVEKLIGSLFG
jgi:putative SOS response-associated peptidase YedK